MNPTTLHDLNAVALVLAGIVLSILLPLAVAALRKASGLEGTPLATPTFLQKLAAAWERYGGTKYLLILLGATLVAVAIVYLLGMKFFTTRDAILAGFAWESLLSKTLTKKQP